MQTGYARVVDVRGVHASAEPIAHDQHGVASFRVRLENGRTIMLGQSEFELRRDGSYYLPRAFEEVPAERTPTERIVVPVVEERVNVQKQVREVGGVRIHKRVHEEQFVVDEVLSYDEITVVRVPVNQYVSEPVSVRQENDTMIVPVLEEVLVTEKRLLLREELHVTRRQQSRREPESITLRREEAIVERIDRGAESKPREEDGLKHSLENPENIERGRSNRR